MGDSYREYVKGRNRASYRARQATDLQTAIDARARAIREKNRKKAAQAAQAGQRTFLDAF